MLFDLKRRLSVLIIPSKLTFFFNLSRIKSFIRFCENLHSICLLEMSRDFIAPTCFFVCFSKAFPKREYANLACSINCL